MFRKIGLGFCLGTHDQGPEIADDGGVSRIGEVDASARCGGGAPKRTERADRGVPHNLPRPVDDVAQ